MASNITNPCTIVRTLTIAISSPPTIPPANGYTVKWRPVGTIPWNVVSNLYGNVFSISNVPGCYNIEGTIQADCAGGGSSNPVTFAVANSFSSCISYKLLDVGVYQYTPCGNTIPTVVEVTEVNVPVTVCAVAGTVVPTAGLTFSTDNSSCTTTIL